MSSVGREMSHHPYTSVKKEKRKDQDKKVREVKKAKKEE